MRLLISGQLHRLNQVRGNREEERVSLGMQISKRGIRPRGCWILLSLALADTSWCCARDLQGKGLAVLVCVGDSNGAGAAEACSTRDLWLHPRLLEMGSGLAGQWGIDASGISTPQQHIHTKDGGRIVGRFARLLRDPMPGRIWGILGSGGTGAIVAMRGGGKRRRKGAGAPEENNGGLQELRPDMKKRYYGHAEDLGRSQQDVLKEVFENLGKEDEYGKGPRKLRRKMPRKVRPTRSGCKDLEMPVASPGQSTLIREIAEQQEAKDSEFMSERGYESGRAEKKRKWVEKRFGKKNGKTREAGGGPGGGVDQAKVREVEKLFGM